jgi:hypothetical protein
MEIIGRRWTIAYALAGWLNFPIDARAHNARARAPSVGSCHFEIAVGEGGRWAATRN